MPAPSAVSQGVRTVVSLLLCIHLFAIFVGVLLAGFTGAYSRSPLQYRLLQVMGPYIGLFNFDASFSPYYLTHGMPQNDDHFLEVEILPGGEKVEFPSAAGLRMGLSYHRDMNLAKLFAINAEYERDEVTGLIAKRIGGYVMRNHGAEKAVVRCQRHTSQPLDISSSNPEFAQGMPTDPTDPRYLVTVYAADVWLDKEGEPQVLKRSAASEVAPTETRRGAN